MVEKEGDGRWVQVLEKEIFSVKVSSTLRGTKAAEHRHSLDEVEASEASFFSRVERQTAIYIL